MKYLHQVKERVFEEAGIRRPQEGRWDLMGQTFLLLLLLVFGLCLALVNLAFLMGKNIRFNLDTRKSSEAHFYLPQVSWVYYALTTALILTALILLLRRLVAAWKNRSRHARG
jgi:hypothetical protein